MEANNDLFRSLASPLHAFIDSVIHAPLIAAPERREELEHILTQHGLSSEIRGDKDYWFEASRLLKQVRTSFPALERIWVYSYVSMLVHLRMEATLFKGPVSLTTDKEGQDARELLRWALVTEFEDASITWPSHLPRPEKPQATTPLLQSANNLFITTVGFAHLHEIGHIILQHGRNDKEDEIQ